MAHKKVGWLKDATMKANGIFAKNGEQLVSGKFDKKAIESFNGKAKKVVIAPVIEKVAAEIEDVKAKKGDKKSKVSK